MPSITNLNMTAYREESRELDQLIDALCLAAPGFLPIVLDAEGVRDGKPYRYATIGSIRRSTEGALWMNRLWVNHCYGWTDNTEYVVTVLRHGSGQFMSSTSPIPYYPDAQEHKARKTTTCRTHLEGLLSIVAEEDSDCAGLKPQSNPEVNDIMAKARCAIEGVSTLEEAEQKMAKVREYIAAGKLPEEAEAEFEEIVTRRFNKEVSK